MRAAPLSFLSSWRPCVLFRVCAIDLVELRPNVGNIPGPVRGGSEALNEGVVIPQWSTARLFGMRARFGCHLRRADNVRFVDAGLSVQDQLFIVRQVLHVVQQRKCLVQVNHTALSLRKRIAVTHCGTLCHGADYAMGWGRRDYKK